MVPPLPFVDMASLQSLWADLWAPGEPQVRPEHGYVLVDHAGAPGLIPELARLGLPWRSLFEGSREEQALSVAPILIALGACAPAAPPRILLLMAWLAEQCAHTSAVLCLRSALAEPVLRRHLVQRLDAQLPEGLPVLLRYFDARTFTVLDEVMTGEQLSAFLGIASRWAWMDRAGAWRLRAAEALSESQLAPWQWALTLDQEAALVAAAEPDAVMLLMRRVAPDLCEPVGPAELHRRVSQALVPARRLGLEDVRQLALFCLAEIEHGPAFHEQAQWQAALAAQPTGVPMNFEAVIQHWEAACAQS
jgi:hypothetical protein